MTRAKDPAQWPLLIEIELAAVHVLWDTSGVRLLGYQRGQLELQAIISDRKPDRIHAGCGLGCSLFPL